MQLPPAPKRPGLDQLLAQAKERVLRMTPEELDAMHARQAIGYVIAEMVMTVHEPEGKDPRVLRDIARHGLMRIQGTLDDDPEACARASGALMQCVRRLIPHDKRELVARIEKDLADLEQLPL